MTDFDSPWKEALDVYFEAFLKLFFPDVHADIDWERGFEVLDKELQQIAPDAEIGRRYVDKLIKVWLRDGAEQWVLIHVEVQMSQEVNFGWRIYVYNYRLFDSYNREVASFVILGDDNPNWRPNSFGYSRWGVKVGIEFPVIKLLDYREKREELEQSDNPFATVVLAHLDTIETRQDQHERMDRKFRLTRRLFERGWGEKEIRQLFRLIDWMMDLPKPLEKVFWDQVKQYGKENVVPYITTPERIGMEKGLAQGRIEAIETLLKLRFREAGLELMPEIRQIDDVEKLAAILHEAETVGRPDDLRKLLAN